MGLKIGDRVKLRSPRRGYTGSLTGTVVKIGSRFTHVEMDRRGNGARIQINYATAFIKIN
jgi:hypothetical protein